MKRLERQSVDVTEFIDNQKFSPYQWLVAILCFLVVAADGYDTGSVAYIGSALSHDWGVARSALGPVMSAALVGYGIGALLAGPLADRFGRKGVIVASTLLFGAFSYWSAYAVSVEELSVLRLITGIGLGAAMPNTVTLTSEFAPARMRSIVVNTQLCGFSAGLALGGLSSAWLIPHLGWTSVLIAGGIAPMVLAVFLLIFLPESTPYLVTRKGAHDRVAKILKRIAPDYEFVDCTFKSCEEVNTTRKSSAIKMLFIRRFLPGTVLLWVTYFMNLVTFYMFTMWLPTLFSDAGFSQERSSLVTSLFPVGGLLGGIAIGYIMDRMNATRVVAFTFFMVAVLALVVARSLGYQSVLPLLIFVMGAVASAASVAMATLAATYYPTACRATGISWMLSIGRFGAVTGSFGGAVLTSMGWGFAGVISMLAVPSLIASLCLCALAVHREKKHAIDESVVLPGVVPDRSHG